MQPFAVAMGLGWLAFAAVSAAGWLPRNAAVGIRIRSTMRSDAAWRAGHRAAAPWLALGVLPAAVAPVLPEQLGWVMIALGSLMVAVLAGVVASRAAAATGAAAPRVDDPAVHPGFVRSNETEPSVEDIAANWDGRFS